MHARHFGVQFDLVVDGDPEHRACLGRGRRANDGSDLGEEACGRGAQRNRGWFGGARGRARLLRWSGQTGQFLVVRDGIAFADEKIGDLGAFLVGARHRLPARHDKSGHAHQVGEAGIGGFRDHHKGLNRCVLFLRLRAMLPPVISRRESGKEHHAQPTLEVFGKRHRWINQLDRRKRRPRRGYRWLKKSHLFGIARASREGAGRFFAVELHTGTRELTWPFWLDVS